jgi:hypothetical protein
MQHDEKPADGKAKGGRPTLVVHRSEFLKLRVTPEEKRMLMTLAENARASVSDYVRCKTIGQPVPMSRPPKGDRAALLSLLAELGKIGSNINQLARSANRGRAVEILQLAQVLDELHTLHAAILSELGK